ncbi:amidohydrolase [Geomonas anaerohicana]|uniref:Amidohydrolase n=1 Tax=Geomonas anaerohicana TaxID=2798583 RepID=A0ABS0YCZ9_9BACT|nr:amidohydrolase [Geomonas anaerohicana]MBJ6750174.1 amidohydrolase [Geomonas anaerohicana]
MPTQLQLQSVNGLVEAELPSLVEIYKHLHARPELSGQERATASLLAGELKTLGFTVTEHLGRYSRFDWPGYGVLAVLENGAGPTLLMRADMDALPVEEKTGLPYASTARAIYRDGAEVPVMHACGHDVHVSCLLGAARVLARARGCWAGTLVLVGQPGEEGGDGAQAMIDDGAYRLCPKPDYALALHSTLFLKAGTAGYAPGNFLASFTEVEIVVRGVGAHGSAPEHGKDPVVMAAQVVLALQTIVSREITPHEPAVVTVGSIHGGAACNVIPEEVVLQLSIRSYDNRVRDKILESVKRICAGVALAAGVPEERSPIVSVLACHPATYNDPALAERVAEALRGAIGADNVVRSAAKMVSEDFGSWGLGGEIPICMFWLGAADPVLFEEGQRQGVSLPSQHSPLYAPLPEPTLRAGVKALVGAACDLLPAG